jgi:hypothetical protein
MASSSSVKGMSALIAMQAGGAARQERAIANAKGCHATSLRRFLSVRRLPLTRRDSLTQKRFRKPRTRDTLTGSQIIKLGAEIQLDSNAGQKSHVV